MLSTDFKKDDRGVERCTRIATFAIQNIADDPSKGYHNEQAVCNWPIATRMSDGVRGCSRCDREPAVGNVKPRITNAAGISLTDKELKECGVTKDTSKEAAKKISKKLNEATKKAVEAKVSKVKKDELVLVISLQHLESDADIAALLIKKASAALDELPVTNFAESKRLIRLQEKLEALVRV